MQIWYEVFVQSRRRAQELFNELVYDKVYVDVIHAERTQAQRDATIKAFRDGTIWVLICTDLMGRGVRRARIVWCRRKLDRVRIQGYCSLRNQRVFGCNR